MSETFYYSCFKLTQSFFYTTSFLYHVIQIIVEKRRRDATGAMTCWHCDAMTFEECEANGQERECHDNEVTISIITQYI